MVVNHEFEMRVHSTIDETYAIRRSLYEGCVVPISAVVKRVGTVDQSVVECWWTTRLGRDVQLVNGLKVWLTMTVLHDQSMKPNCLPGDPSRLRRACPGLHRSSLSRVRL